MTDPKVTGISAGVVGNVTDANAPKSKKPVEDKPKEDILKKSDENEQVGFECTDGNDDGKISFGQGMKSFWNGLVNRVKNLLGIGTKSVFQVLLKKDKSCKKK